VRAADLWRDRQHELKTAERRAANLALILSEFLGEAFQAADASLRHLALHARLVGGAAAPSAAWEGPLRAARAALPGVGSLSIVDADGTIRHSTITQVVGQSRRDQYIFQRLSADPTDVLVASTPFRSLTRPDQVMIPLGRPVTTAEGGFDGMVVATFIPQELRGFFQKVDVGQRGTVWVFHPDGIVLFQEPSPANPIGQVAAGNPIFEAARRLGDTGTLRQPLRPSGPRMISAFQRLREPALVVAVSLNEAEVLAAWRRELVVSTTLIALLVVLAASMLWLSSRQIGARAAAEEALQRAQRLEALGHLTGGVAHDFNNILTVILGNVALLQRRGSSSAAVVDGRIHEIGRAAERAAALTSQLLTFARRQPLQPQLVDLSALARALRPMLERLIGEDVTLKMNLSAAPCPASLDPAQTEHALVNLCANARDAMPYGGLLLVETDTVVLDEAYARMNTEVAPGAYALVSVSDTGTGITPEHLARVFEPFFTTKEPGKGTGLGLSSVYGFVKQSGGHAKVYTELGRGTVVKLYFPQAADGAVVSALEPRSPAEPRPATGELILLVEDEDALRELATEMLEELGYRVVAAADGPAALARARELPRIDLLLTDVVLPKGMTGRQVAEELARQRPGLRVLYASGYSQDVIQHRGQLAPGLCLLSKPYNLDELAQAVREVMGPGPGRQWGPGERRP
jgi:signal transduction histidine kinase/ActR/RegA family two-component response regulator